MSSYIRRGLAAACLLSALVVPGIAGQVISPAVASASTCHADGPGYSDMPGSDPATACTPAPTPTPTPTPKPKPKPPTVTPTPPPAPRHVPRPIPAPVVVNTPPAAPAAPVVVAPPTQAAPTPALPPTEAPAVHTAVDNAAPAPVSYRFPWLLTAVVLLLTAVAGIRLWLRTGHRWNGKVRRIVAGPAHDLHHHLLLAAAENADTATEDAVPADRFTWPLIGAGVLLLPFTVAALAGIRLWLRTGHRWNGKVRRLVAGPDHNLHHHLILDAAEHEEQDEKTPV